VPAAESLAAELAPAELDELLAAEAAASAWIGSRKQRCGCAS
jgi:hypothetical protein